MPRDVADLSESSAIESREEHLRASLIELCCEVGHRLLYLTLILVYGGTFGKFETATVFFVSSLTQHRGHSKTRKQTNLGCVRYQSSDSSVLSVSV